MNTSLAKLLKKVSNFTLILYFLSFLVIDLYNSKTLLNQFKKETLSERCKNSNKALIRKETNSKTSITNDKQAELKVSKIPNNKKINQSENPFETNDNTAIDKEIFNNNNIYNKSSNFKSFDDTDILKKEKIQNDNVYDLYQEDVLFNNYSQDYNINNIVITESDSKLDLNPGTIDSDNICFHSFNEDIIEIENYEYINTRGEKILKYIKDSLKQEKENLIVKNINLRNKFNSILRLSSHSHSNNTNGTGNTNTYNNFYAKQNTTINNPFSKATDVDEHEQQFNLTNNNFNINIENTMNKKNITNDMNNFDNNVRVNNKLTENNNNNFNLLNNKHFKNIQTQTIIGNNEIAGLELKTASNKYENLVQELNNLLEMFEKSKTKFNANSNNLD